MTKSKRNFPATWFIWIFNGFWFYRALRNSLNENLLASPIISNSSHDFNGSADVNYGRQSLDALAAAALQASNSKTVANLSQINADSKIKDGSGCDSDGEKWMVVGIFKTLTHNVTNYVDYQWRNSTDQLTSENIPDLSLLEKIPVEQGRTYRFRIAGVNACGVGKFSEVRNSIFNCFIFILHMFHFPPFHFFELSPRGCNGFFVIFFSRLDRSKLACQDSRVLHRA